MDNKYNKPSVSLLSLSKKNIVTSSQEMISTTIMKIESFFKDEKINVKVVEVNASSHVTIYRLELDKGTRVDSLTKLKNDLAFNFGLEDIDIIIPIPGTSLVGIVVPNKEINNFSLRELMQTYPKNNDNNKIIVPLGRDMYGKEIFIDLVEHFHLLITGCHHTGKSNLLNSFILSILLKYSPDNIRLVLVDPKISGFNYYEGIPHLLVPILTDYIKINSCMQKLGYEMDERLEAFKNSYTKNIKSYNEYVDNELKKNSECGLKHMPFIFVIIDSYQDILLQSDKDFDNYISKLIYDGEKVGIHLIISIDDTANFYSNKMHIYDFISIISFKSKRDDGKFYIKEAKKLFSNGDAYIKYIFNNEIRRFFTPIINDDETIRVTDFIKLNNKVVSNDNFIMNNIDGKSNNKSNDTPDVLYNEILEYAIRMGQISASLIQRKYSIGYNRACRIIDVFEKRGIIGPAKGSKPRDVLVKLEDESDIKDNNNNEHIKNHAVINKESIINKIKQFFGK